MNQISVLPRILFLIIILKNLNDTFKSIKNNFSKEIRSTSNFPEILYKKVLNVTDFVDLLFYILLSIILIVNKHLDIYYYLIPAYIILRVSLTYITLCAKKSSQS
ncbi:hypothetical protein UT300012_29490 [Paraclostridium bifermentans]